MRCISHRRATRRVFRLLSLSSLALMLAAGLGLASLGYSDVHAAEKPDKGGIIIWAVHESMPDFDTHYESSYIAAQPIGPIYNGLVTQDVYNEGKIVGDLAERWEVSEDGKRVTFFLHKGVKFHDGSDFTCADAQYSLDKLADRKRANPTFVGVLEPVYDQSSCTDDFTLVLSLKQPSAAIMTLLSGAHSQ